MAAMLSNQIEDTPRWRRVRGMILQAFFLAGRPIRDAGHFVFLLGLLADITRASEAFLSAAIIAAAKALNLPPLAPKLRVAPLTSAPTGKAQPSQPGGAQKAEALFIVRTPREPNLLASLRLPSPPTIGAPRSLPRFDKLIQRLKAAARVFDNPEDAIHRHALKMQAATARPKPEKKPTFARPATRRARLPIGPQTPPQAEPPRHPVRNPEPD